MIIDERDTICREFAPDTDGMDAYVNLLRLLFKGSDTISVFAGVSMTGNAIRSGGRPEHTMQ